MILGIILFQVNKSISCLENDQVLEKSSLSECCGSFYKLLWHARDNLFALKLTQKDFRFHRLPTNHE